MNPFKLVSPPLDLASGALGRCTCDLWHGRWWLLGYESLATDDVEGRVPVADHEEVVQLGSGEALAALAVSQESA